MNIIINTVIESCKHLELKEICTLRFVCKKMAMRISKKFIVNIIKNRNIHLLNNGNKMLLNQNDINNTKSNETYFVKFNKNNKSVNYVIKCVGSDKKVHSYKGRILHYYDKFISKSTLELATNDLVTSTCMFYVDFKREDIFSIEKKSTQIAKQYSTFEIINLYIKMLYPRDILKVLSLSAKMKFNRID